MLSASPVRTIASWVNGQPFGCAVVPDVYIMIAGVADADGLVTRRKTTLAGTDGCSASKAARSRKPSGELSPSITQTRSRGVASSASAAGSAEVGEAGEGLAELADEVDLRHHVARQQDDGRGIGHT